MKKLLRSVATVAAATVVSGSLLAGLAGTAHAAGNPPWEPIGNPPEVGGLTFYNTSGQVITSGSTTSASIAAYVQGSSTVRAGDTKATLFAYTPVNGQLPGAWSHDDQLSSSTAYPNAGAPAALAGSSLPLVTGAAGDESLATDITNNPNSDVSGDGYAGLYVLRLYTSSPGNGGSTTYDEAVVSVSGTTWTLDYSPSTAITPTLATSPASPQFQGSSVTLTATVPVGVPGSITFDNGGTPITGATNVPVSAAGSASTTVTGLPVGSNSLTAVFTPTSGSAFAGGTSTASAYTINAPSPTTTSLAVSPTSPQNVGTSETLTATVTAGVAGSVQFVDNGSNLGSPVAVSGGTASTTTTALPLGTDSLTAVFTPTSNAYAQSTSSAVSFVIQPLGDHTATALAVNLSGVTVGSPVTVTADVADTDTPGPVPAGDGTVSFYDNGSDTSGVVSGSSTLLDAAPVALAAGGVATYSVAAGFTAGEHNLVAVFTTSTTAYKPSASSDVTFTLDPSGTAGDTSSSPGNVDVGIQAGSLLITTPYTTANPFHLGNATLNPLGYYTASAAFGNPAVTTSPTANGGVSITDTQAGDGQWTASAQVTDFTNEGGPGVINGQNLAFIGDNPAYITGNALNGTTDPVVTSPVTSTAVSTNTPYSSTATGSDGLKGVPHAFATAATGDGSVYVDGTLSLIAPSSTPAGTYSATLTFTIA
jgi:hypothetical protein